MKKTTAIAIHPEYNLYQKGNTAYCTSLQVAEEFGKEHFIVMRDIRELDCSEEFRKYNFVCTSQNVDMPNGGIRKENMFLITRDGFMFLAMGYKGKKAGAIKEAIIKRFNDMENFIRDYILAKDDFAPFTQAIMDAHQEPKNYHYSNEYNMINRIVLGMDAKHFREAHGIQEAKSIRPFLSDEQSKAIKKLQLEDIRLLYRGLDYEARKLFLEAVFLNIQEGRLHA